MNNLETMVSRYIITAAELGALPNLKQLDAYDRYSKETGASIIIIPIEGQYKEDETVLHERFGEYIIASDMKLSKRIKIENFGIRAQNINPLTGLKRFSSVDSSDIIGSPKQHLEFIANSNKYDPHAIMSTGVCTLPNYKNYTRIGKIGEKDHKQGCVLVDIETGGTYHFRQVQSDEEGSFITLGRKYCPNRKSSAVNADTIVLGDLHVANLDSKAYEASLQMIKELKPKFVVLHDIFDGRSITHHDMDKLMVRGKKAKLGQLSLSEELYKVGEVLGDISKAGPEEMKVVVVKSNHDETLDKYLNNVRFVGDSHNLELSIKLAHSMIDGKDPLQEGIKLSYGKLPKRTVFLGRDSDFNRYGWNLGFHGDIGPSGSRGSPTSFEYSLGKAIVAHSHSPFIRKDIYRVGTLECMDVDYTKGSTGNWSFTNGVLYKNEKVELVNIFGGKWKL